MEQAWKDALKSRGVNGSLGSYFHEGEDIFFTLRDTSQLLHYNFGTKELQLIDAGEKLRGIVVKDTVYYCITAQEGAVLYFDPAVGNSSKRYGTMEDMRSYVRIFKLGNQFLLLGEKELDYFDEEGEIRRCEISEEMVRKYRGPLYAVNSCLDGVNYLFPYGADKLLAFEEDGSLRASYALDFTEEEIRKSNLHKLFLQGVVEEGKEICAETMMEYLAMQEPRVTDGEELPITF